MELFLQTLIDGGLIGGLIIVVGVGFSLCFGVMHIVDFAVGEWVMLGAYAAYWLVRYLRQDPMVYLPLIFALFFAAGWLVYPLIYRAVSGRRHHPALMGLVFTFGLSTLIKGGALSAWGYHVRSVSTWLSGQSVTLGVTTFPALRLAGFVFGVLATVLFMVFLYGTRLGVSIRATAQDRETAALLGVDVRRVGALVYGTYAGLTGMTGVLIGALFSIHAAMGAKYVIFAFFVVVLAGMGYVPGVIVAGLLLGLIQSFVGVYISGRYTLLALFLLMYLSLLVAPRGILRRGL
ncbi:MAG: branched-chain amino acid ABC transporter permease [Armatimonadota bacterium]|nr:branched-chain amino acid ABC transporter permease [Armatimonadota bacterium]MDR7450664.1 branched-chain amino acid ABC transporter permease [Armatimonadota bacterium]MDR7466020.1 branched-chain amino acid ABC transporter permease [Armatimonadota bacterium]MDR7493943.1 branched-chain amino acid ABC transporter permease [Armatimonadota bacterium]MDR7504048.1 branched-chain amino acid ABC transporter permease [Armatimonadota bacterium]